MKTFGFVLAAVAAVALNGCSDPEGARHALHQAGYTEVETEGHSWFGCSEKDTFATNFKANGPTGLPVTGQVCSGWLKGNTIRLD